jgi:hypothetical protein
MATDMTVSRTILEQLGGRGFMIMTGSKNFVGGENTLSFKVGSGAKHPSGKRVTAVRITLTPSDVYTVEFLAIRKFEVTVLETVENVYCDMLQDVFMTYTGFETRLPRFARG